MLQPSSANKTRSRFLAPPETNSTGCNPPQTEGKASKCARSRTGGEPAQLPFKLQPLTLTWTQHCNTPSPIPPPSAFPGLESEAIKPGAWANGNSGPRNSVRHHHQVISVCPVCPGEIRRRLEMESPGIAARPAQGKI